MNESDTVILSQDVSEHELKIGDVGVIVHKFQGGETFEVEFATTGGKTIAVLTLDASCIRPMGGGEILHVRKLSAT